MGSDTWNSGPHAFPANALPAEPSPQPHLKSSKKSRIGIPPPRDFNSIGIGCDLDLDLFKSSLDDENVQLV